MDSIQAQVASLPFLRTPTAVSNPGSASPVYVSLVADSLSGKIDNTDNNAATITSLKQMDAPTNLPAEVTLPLGLISFTATVGLGPVDATGKPTAIAETFSLYIDPGLQANGYWVQNVAGTWVNLASEVYGGKIVIEGNKVRLDFTITDGGEFDKDGKLDGVISDMGGVGLVPLSVVGYAPDLAVDMFWF